MAEADQSIIDYVQAHRYAVLATQRRAGPPQLTLINYLLEDGKYLITVRGQSVKAKNLRRRPEASMAIVDGRQQVIVYGTTELIEDIDEVVTIAPRLRKQAGAPQWSEQETRDWAEREQRVIIVFTPARYYPATLPPPAPPSPAR
jgi:PPOX class probable F420-dependent enzyme